MRDKSVTHAIVDVRAGSSGPVTAELWLALQQVLAGMPKRRPELVVCGRGDDQTVVVGTGRTVLFGPYHRDDLRMRNIGMVTFTQVGFPVNEVAEVRVEAGHAQRPADGVSAGRHRW